MTKVCKEKAEGPHSILVLKPELGGVYLVICFSYNDVTPPLCHLDLDLIFSLIIPLKWFYIFIYLLYTCGLSPAMRFDFIQSFLSEFLAVSWLLYGSENPSALFTLTFKSLRNEAESGGNSKVTEDKNDLSIQL